MRLIDGDALEKFLADAEMEATKRKKYVLAGALNMIQGNVRNFPTIEAGSNWISCKERLPSDEDYDETFTVTIQCEHYDGWDDYVTGYADWTPHGWDIQSCYMRQIKVIAWQPLPEPYKGEGDAE